MKWLINFFKRLKKRSAPKMPGKHIWQEEWNEHVFRSFHQYDNFSDFFLNYDDFKKFIQALAYAESGFNLTERYVENLGNDAVTGKQVVSEGLFQLSYQDSIYNGVTWFNWDQDKNLSDDDPDKTIFDPINQIYACAKILNKQINRRGTLYTSFDPFYWSVLDEKNKRHRVFLSYYEN